MSNAKEKATLTNNKSGENTGSSVTQTSPSPCEPDGPVYSIGLIVTEVATGQVLSEEHYGFATESCCSMAGNNAITALKREILMMFTFDDIRSHLEECAVEAELDEGYDVIRSYNEGDVMAISDETYWDNCIEDSNIMLSNVIMQYVHKHLVRYNDE